MGMMKKFFLARQEITRQKFRIKLKTALFTSIAAVIFLTTLIGIVYFLGFNLLRDKAVESQLEMARTLASSIGSGIEKQAEVLRLSANTQFIIDALKENNLKYSTRGEKEIQRYLMDMDKRWIEAPDDHPIIKEYLDNNLSLKLSEMKREHGELTGIVITDKFGGLAGSTTRPSGFYSFDKDWWLDSYAKGRGRIYLGGVEYDEKDNVWCLPFAIPVEDEAGAVIGVCKACVNIGVFFNPLAHFKVGRTGNAVLVDDKAFLLYHPKAPPFANKFCEYEEFQKTLQNGDKWGVLDSAYLNRGKMLTAYSEVNISYPSIYFYSSSNSYDTSLYDGLHNTPQNNLLSSKKYNWFVFVDRDLREIFSPLYKLIFIMTAIGIALTIILGLSVFILSGQEPPSYSMLQVIKENAEVKAEDKDYGPLDERARRLPKEKEL
jgi:hypothetical protein